MSKNEVLTWLKLRGTRRTVEGMARYGIEAKRAFGVPMGTLLSLRRRLGRDHALAKGARDERNFFKKGVNWALRAIGRRSPALNEAALGLAGRLAESDEPSCRWVGKDAVRG